MIGMLPGVTMAVQALFGQPGPGWSSVFTNVKQKNYEMAAQSFIRGVTGMRIGGIGGQATTEFDLFNTVNPLEFGEAPVLKVGLWTGLGVQGIRAFGRLVSGIISDIGA